MNDACRECLRIYREKLAELQIYDDLRRLDEAFCKVLLNRDYSPKEKRKRLNAIDEQRNALINKIKTMQFGQLTGIE